VPLDLTFHIDRPAQGRTRGNLCLWEDSWSADVAPWLEAQTVLDRIADWLLQTALGWPGDRACDLERYLPREDTLVLYDSAVPLTGLARAKKDGNGVISVLARPLGRPQTARQPADHRKSKRAGRPPENIGWVWVCDVGSVDAPVGSWSEVLALLGSDAATVKHEAELSRTRWLLIHYSRGGAPGVLALHLHYTPAGGVQVRSCEAADTSVETRMLRAGAGAAALADVRIAIVGCGAVGSFVADTLFRSGLRHLDLRDHESLRPGNVVRHLAGLDEVGRSKVEAVRRALAKIDPDTSTVSVHASGVWTLDQAVALLQCHDLVVDATGSARASSLLSSAAELTDQIVVSACVQRDGDVVRVDRMPLRGSETYLPPLNKVDDDDQPRERGCGSPVSLTPPGAVLAAAELACRVVIDEVSGSRSLPATLADVRRPQPEAPFNRLGLVSASPSPGSGLP
jgi:molybdopterin/thiamine biosynthesis adenylyltransferase